MSREATTIVGSGINPKKQRLEFHPQTGERHLHGINVVLVNPEDGSAGFGGATSQVDVANSVVELPPAPLVYRRAMSIYNNSTDQTFYIGFNTSVTMATGWPVPPKTSIALEINGEVRVYGIASTTNVDVRVLELS